MLVKQRHLHNHLNIGHVFQGEISLSVCSLLSAISTALGQPQLRTLAHISYGSQMNIEKCFHLLRLSVRH
jgi:hypothetical protein